MAPLKLIQLAKAKILYLHDYSPIAGRGENPQYKVKCKQTLNRTKTLLHKFISFKNSHYSTVSSPSSLRNVFSLLIQQTVDL